MTANSVKTQIQVLIARREALSADLQTMKTANHIRIMQHLDPKYTEKALMDMGNCFRAVAEELKSLALEQESWAQPEAEAEESSPERPDPKYKKGDVVTYSSSFSHLRGKTETLGDPFWNQPQQAYWVDDSRTEYLYEASIGGIYQAPVPAPLFPEEEESWVLHAGEAGQADRGTWDGDSKEWRYSVHFDGGTQSLDVLESHLTAIPSPEFAPGQLVTTLPNHTYTKPIVEREYKETTPGQAWHYILQGEGRYEILGIGLEAADDRRSDQQRSGTERRIHTCRRCGANMEASYCGVAPPILRCRECHSMQSRHS